MPTRIAQYEIAEEIGRGGFGRVYKAYDPKVGREVAIKTLNDSDDQELISRFRVEAAAAGNLRHANIVTIYEFGEWEGTHYLAMEYLPGRDLNRLIKEGNSISVLEAVTIMNQVAQALSFAHNHGVVHRDIKPANIMVLPDGVVKIMDFGIARLTSDSQAHLTKSGFIIGTLLYLAPEQFSGKPFDSLCDIWAFGVVYYELLTGGNPFKASDDAASMYRITAVDPAPIRSARPDCPVELEQLINRLLQRNKEDRYQSLEDVVFDTEPILRQLRKDRANSLQKVVEGMMQDEKLGPAQAVVRQMLELDPSNTQARQWRDQLRKQVRDQEIRPRVEGLVASAESELERRNFAEATQLLQSALSLDPGNIAVQNRLDAIRREQERYRHVQTLLEQAKQDLEAQNVSNALFRASEAAAADPGSEAARLLVREIQEYADRRDKKRKTDSALAAARDLIQSQSYEQALRVLQDLRSTFSDEPRIEELIAEIAKRRSQDQLNERLAQGIARARELLQADRFTEAAALLAELQREFPQDQTLRELHAFAIKQNEAYREKTEADRIGREAWELAKGSNFEAALKMVDEGLRNFPAEAILVRVRVAIRSAQARHEEEVDVRTILQLSHGLVEHQQLDEAIAAVQGGLRRFPTRAELLELLGHLQQQRWQHERDVEEQTRAELERAFAPEPTLPWDATPQPVAEVAPPTPAPPVDARRHPAFDPSLSAPILAGTGRQGIPRRKKTWLWGVAAGVGAGVLIAVVIWMSKPASHSAEAEPGKAQHATVEPQRMPSESPAPAAPAVKAEPPVNKTEKKTGPETKTGATKTVAPVFANSTQKDTKATESSETAKQPVAPVKPQEVASVPPSQNPSGPVMIPSTTANTPAPEPVSKRPWHGDDSGQMRWRGSLAPGATIDLVRTDLEASNKFPWLTETKVQVKVVSPSSVSIEVQPSRANRWSTIRLRNNGPQPVTFVSLSWQIVE